MCMYNITHPGNTVNPTKPKHIWLTPEKRFWSKVDKNGPIPKYRPDLGNCWLWKPSKSLNHYGGFWLGRDGKRYILACCFLINIPIGLSPDHLCLIKSCVRPSHIEAVTKAENARRAYVARKNNYLPIKSRVLLCSETEALS